MQMYWHLDEMKKKETATPAAPLGHCPCNVLQLHNLCTDWEACCQSLVAWYWKVVEVTKLGVSIWDCTTLWLSQLRQKWWGQHKCHMSTSKPSPWLTPAQDYCDSKAFMCVCVHVHNSYSNHGNKLEKQGKDTVFHYLYSSLYWLGFNECHLTSSGRAHNCR